MCLCALGGGGGASGEKVGGAGRALRRWGFLSFVSLLSGAIR